MDCTVEHFCHQIGFGFRSRMVSRQFTYEISKNAEWDRAQITISGKKPQETVATVSVTKHPINAELILRFIGLDASYRLCAWQSTARSPMGSNRCSQSYLLFVRKYWFCRRKHEHGWNRNTASRSCIWFQKHLLSSSNRIMASLPLHLISEIQVGRGCCVCECSQSGRCCIQWRSGQPP